MTKGFADNARTSWTRDWFVWDAPRVPFSDKCAWPPRETLLQPEFWMHGGQVGTTLTWTMRRKTLTLLTSRLGRATLRTPVRSHLDQRVDRRFIFVFLFRDCSGVLCVLLANLRALPQVSLKQNGVYTLVITSGCTDCPLRTQPTFVAELSCCSFH